MYYCYSLNKLQQENSVLLDKQEVLTYSLNKLQQENSVLLDKQEVLTYSLNKLQQENSVLLDKQEVLTAQIQLVKYWEQAVKKAIDFADEHISKMQDYCELKGRDRSWTDSLSEDEKYKMYILRKEIGGDVSITAKDVMIYRAYYIKELSLSLNEILQPLKDTLYSWPRNMDKMKSQQTKMSPDNAEKRIVDCIEKWQYKLRHMQSMERSSTWGMVIYGVYYILKKILQKAAEELPRMIIKALKTYMFS